MTADRLSCRFCDNCLPPNQFLRNGNQCTSSRNTICTACTDNKITTAENSPNCNTCASGYFSQASGITFVCAKCTDYPCGANQYISCANAVRACQTCPGVTAGTACAWGQEPDKQCDGRSTEPSQCRDCLAGSERPSGSTSLICEKCKTGFYKDMQSASSCSPCANAPAANSVYLPWGNSAAHTSNCPW